MPLIIKQLLENKQVIVGVWEINESLESLSAICPLNRLEEISFKAIKNENRAKQWLISRILLNELSDTNDLSVVYEKNGRPLINDGIHHVSISHTSKYVAVILSRYFKVGIDIEGIHPRILKIRPKFVSDDENLFLQNTNALTESLILIWSAKEALFKMDGRGNMDFKRNLSIKPFSVQKEGQIFGVISKDEISLDFSLDYQIIQDHILVYVMAPI